MTTKTPFPLGRQLFHDPLSKNWRLTAPTLATPKTVLFKRYGEVLDQGELGSCTGNALAHAMNHSPLWGRIRYKHAGIPFQESDAVRLYSRATELDVWLGEYTAAGGWEDTGSDGLSVCKAGKEFGYLKEYRHTFSFDEFLIANSTQPTIIGINWYEDMFYPDGKGFIVPTGWPVGGHEVAVVGVNMYSKYVTIQNSWSEVWGLKGRARIRFADMARLLSEDGDCTVPIAA